MQDDDAQKKATEREAAHSRGKASALTGVGVAGGFSWLALEAAGETLLATSSLSNKQWKTVGFVTALITLGAVGAAIYHHRHADEIEEAQKRMDEKKPDWRLTIQGQRAHEEKLARELGLKR